MRSGIPTSPEPPATGVLPFRKDHQTRSCALPAALHHDVVRRAGLLEDNDFANERTRAESCEEVIRDEAIGRGEEAISETGACFDLETCFAQPGDTRLNRGERHIELRSEVGGG